MTKLTPKQQRFVEEYSLDKNATQAAIRAGYSKKTAKDIGCQNLAKLYIKEAIDEKLSKQAERVEITKELIAGKLLNIIKQREWDDEAQGQRLAIDAMRELNKMYGLHEPEKQELTHKGKMLIENRKHNALLDLLRKQNREGE